MTLAALTGPSNAVLLCGSCEEATESQRFGKFAKGMLGNQIVSTKNHLWKNIEIIHERANYCPEMTSELVAKPFSTRVSSKLLNCDVIVGEGW
jgi:hypothetical protein